MNETRAARSTHERTRDPDDVRRPRHMRPHRLRVDFGMLRSYANRHARNTIHNRKDMAQYEYTCCIYPQCQESRCACGEQRQPTATLAPIHIAAIAPCKCTPRVSLLLLLCYSWPRIRKYTPISGTIQSTPREARSQNTTRDTLAYTPVSARALRLYACVHELKIATVACVQRTEQQQ